MQIERMPCTFYLNKIKKLVVKSERERVRKKCQKYLNFWNIVAKMNEKYKKSTHT